jgi:hypothetical protein
MYGFPQWANLEIEFVRPSARVHPYGRAAFTPGDWHAANFAKGIKPGQRICHYIGHWLPRNKAAEEVLQILAIEGFRAGLIVTSTWNWDLEPEPLPTARPLTPAEIQEAERRAVKLLGPQVDGPLRKPRHKIYDMVMSSAANKN